MVEFGNDQSEKTTSAVDRGNMMRTKRIGVWTCTESGDERCERQGRVYVVRTDGEPSHQACEEDRNGVRSGRSDKDVRESVRGRTESVEERGEEGAEDASEWGELSAVRTKSMPRLSMSEREEDWGRGSDALWVFSDTWGGGVNGTGQSTKALGFCRVPRVWMVSAGRRFVQDEARSLCCGEGAGGESIWEDMVGDGEGGGERERPRRAAAKYEKRKDGSEVFDPSLSCRSTPRPRLT